jgi:phage portal protein BeeE
MIFASIPLKHQTLSKPIKDLMLQETIQDTTRVIAEAYNYPMPLLGFSAGTTFSNRAEANKELYENAIIPEAESFCTFINAEAGIEYDKVKFMVSYQNVAALQASNLEKTEAKKKQAELLSMLLQDGVITADEYREYIKIDELWK